MFRMFWMFCMNEAGRFESSRIDEWRDASERDKAIPDAHKRDLKLLG